MYVSRLILACCLSHVAACAQAVDSVGVRLKITISEQGVGVVTVSQLPLIDASESPQQDTPQPVVHEDKTHEFKHVFNSEDAIGAAFGELEPGHADFDNTSRTLVLTPPQPPKPAQIRELRSQPRTIPPARLSAPEPISRSVRYHRPLGPPLTLAADVVSREHGSLEVKLWQAAGGATLQLRLLSSQDGGIFETVSAVVTNLPNDTSSEIGELKEEKLGADTPTELRFRWPVGDGTPAATGMLISMHAAGPGSVSLARLSVRGRVYPVLGVYKHPDLTGAEVTLVDPTSIAARAGIRKGDKIIRLDSKKIENFSDLATAMQQLNIGQKFTLAVERDGETIEFDLTAE